MNQKNSYVLFLIILGCSGILVFANLTQGHNWGDDFASYIMQAKSIVDFTPHNFIESNRFTIEQSSNILGPIAYPWGFPLLLAPFYSIFGLNLIAFKMVGALSFILFLGVLWHGFRKVHPPFILLCLVCFFALNPVLLKYTNNILSDLPFLFLSTLSIVLIQSNIIDGRQHISKFWDSILIGLVIAIAFSVRSNGILLLITLGFSQIVAVLRERYTKQQSIPEKEQGENTQIFLISGHRFSIKALLQHSVAYLVFFSLVVIFASVFPEGGGSYLSQLKHISLPMLIEHLNYYSLLLSRFFWGIPHEKLVYMASIPFVIVGIIVRFRSAYPEIIYSVLTIILYICWPEPSGLRFLFPILPFYVSFLFSGLEWLSQKKEPMGMGERRLRKVICFTPGLVIILCFAIISARDASHTYFANKISVGPYSETSQRMFTFIADHIDATKTVIFPKPRAMRLLTNRKSIAIDRIEDIFRGDYLCLSLKEKRNINQVPIAEMRELSEHGLASLIYENSDYLVYELKK